MTKTASKTAKQKDPKKAKEGVLQITRDPNKSDERVLAEVVMNPIVRNSHLAGRVGVQLFGDRKNDLEETINIAMDNCKAVREGKLDEQKNMLTCQATTLDTLFTELAGRAFNNVGHYPETVERYMRLALKAQSQCKATIEALDKMAREGTQTIKHVHVDNRGGQAVITDTVQTGGQNEKSDEQSHAKRAEGSKVLGHDPQGNGVPIASREGQEAMQDARRN